MATPAAPIASAVPATTAASSLVASQAEIAHLQEQGLYTTANEHDACGVGFVAHIKGQKTHNIVKQALKILENLDHRGAVGADPLMGDGAGILIQIPDELFRAEMASQGVALRAVSISKIISEKVCFPAYSKRSASPKRAGFVSSLSMCVIVLAMNGIMNDKV